MRNASLPSPSRAFPVPIKHTAVLDVEEISRCEADCAERAGEKASRLRDGGGERSAQRDAGMERARQSVWFVHKGGEARTRSGGGRCAKS